MNDSGKAVFLSYASQDAAAAKRICDALRAGGVEVWFDQSELVGGDAWDQKIRRQIRECALLIPIISANTQARTEGYFRLEWRLADQRTHLMAKGRPFLLPVVIDDTRDGEAQVPDSFTEVQWTRLPRGEVSPVFCARLQKLLGAHGSGEPVARTAHRAGAAERTASPRLPRWVKPLLAGVTMVAGALLLTLKHRFDSGDESARPAVFSANGAVIPAVASARAIWEKDDVTRAELDLASELLTKAAEANPADPGIFAALAFVDQRYLNEFYDTSASRYDAARRHAAKAVALDARSVDARLAQAVSLRQLAKDEPTRVAVLKLLETLHQEQPANVHVLHELAWCHYGLKHGNEARAALSQVEALPGRAGSTAFARGLMECFAGNYAESLRQFEHTDSVKGLLWRSYLQILWTGDLPAAQRTLKEVPAGYFVEDMPALAKFWVEYVSRDYEQALATMRAVPRDFIEAGAGFGPTGYYRGLVLNRLNRRAAAESEWRSALGAVEQRLQKESSPLPLVAKALLLSMLGERAAADRVWQTAKELGVSDGDWLEVDLASHQLEPAAALAWLNQGLGTHASYATAAILRFLPSYDALRGQSGFAELQSRADADPALSPRAKDLPAVNAAASEKSIAVLPFTNMSEDKDSGYFADGVQEDILTNLGNIRELRVVSRTSVMSYRESKKSLRQIAQELRVAFVLEGSVRRAGGKVRISGQLIRAATDEHLWAKNYDRDLTDVFAIQSELAQAIAGELQAKLSPEEAARVRESPTGNLEAYDLYLRARDSYNRMGAVGTREGLQQILELLQRALTLDPGLIRGWSLLVSAHASMIDLAIDQSDARRQLLLTAVEKVEKLAPDTLEAHDVRGQYCYVLRDYTRAYAENEWVLQRHPKNAEAIRSRGVIQRRWGRWTEALATLREAMALDPANILIVQNVALHLWSMRRYDEARAAYQRLAELRPEEIEAGRLPAGLGTLEFLARGTTAEGDAFFAALGPVEKTAPAMIAQRKNWALWKGDHVTFEQLEAQYPDASFTLNAAMVMAIRRADTAALRARLQSYLAELRGDLQREPGNWFKWMSLAQAEALAGDHAGAMRDVEHGLSIMPIAQDAFYGSYARYLAGTVYAWAGEKDRALAELTERIRTPQAVSIYAARNLPEWWPLHGDPRFETLVNDPKNNAPIY